MGYLTSSYNTIYQKKSYYEITLHINVRISVSFKTVPYFKVKSWVIRALKKNDVAKKVCQATRNDVKYNFKFFNTKGNFYPWYLFKAKTLLRFGYIFQGL